MQPLYNNHYLITDCCSLSVFDARIRETYVILFNYYIKYPKTKTLVLIIRKTHNYVSTIPFLKNCHWLLLHVIICPTRTSVNKLRCTCTYSMCEKLQAMRVIVAPVNYIYGSHCSATEATYEVSVNMGNFVEFTRTSSSQSHCILINLKHIYIVNCLYIFPSLNSNQFLFIFYESS